MLNRTRARRRMPNPGSAIPWCCALLACALGAAAPAAAAEEIYRWQGELLALDEAAGTVTLAAPVAAPNALEALADPRAGEPIVITWSGVEGQAGGIRAVARDDGAELADAVDARTAGSEPAGGEEAEEFLLRAAFVAADAEGAGLTFEVALPKKSLGAVRALTRGAPVSVTTARRPHAAVRAVAAAGGAPRRPAPERGAAYRWQGELLALDEAAGALTVRARASSPAGLAAVAGAAPGDPIVVRWSGYSSRASGIRSAMPDDGSGLWGSDRFLLRASFVGIDATERYLTFETKLPKKSLAAVRPLTRGAWASVRSPHHPADGSPAVLSVAAYAAAPRERRPAPPPGAAYRWDGELVSLDEAAGMLTVKSRVASPAGLAAVAGAAPGDPIVVRWSGYSSRASGIRSAMPDDGSGLWGSDRFLLRAAFVETDADNRYLTFRAPVPEESLAAVRSLTRGSWASVRSPHHPADAAAALLSVDAYVAPRERRPAPLPGATYRWDGELVSLDEAAGTVTVRSRVVSGPGLSAVADTESGDPIVITWSGYENRASGVRAAMPDDGSGLWGSTRFLLRATFVGTDAAGRYLTFEAPVPAASLGAMRSLTRGSWASVRSPHHPADAAAALLSVEAYAPSSPERRPAPLPGATYRWDGEFVAFDEAEGTLTVKSRAASPAGLARVADAQPGEAIVITWSGYDTRASGIRAAMPDDGSGLWGSTRFLLRATFVETDAAGGYLTFKVAVPEASLPAIRTLAQGAWASVTSPHHPADAAPAVMNVTAYAAVAAAGRTAQ